MGLFDGNALELAEINARLGHTGETIRKLVQRGPGRSVWVTLRHRPWWELLGKGPDGKHCRECAFFGGIGNSGKYKKCGKQVITNGPGTDIRAKDPACRWFQEEAHV